MKTVTLEIGTEDASRYLLTLTTSAGSAVELLWRAGGQPLEPLRWRGAGPCRWRQIQPHHPSVEDWYQLHLTMDGVTTTYARHSGSKLYNIAMPEGLKLASVVVEDMYGNLSTPVTFRFQNGQVVDLDEQIPAGAHPR